MSYARLSGVAGGCSGCAGNCPCRKQSRRRGIFGRRRALGDLTPVGGTFAVGPGQGCVDGSHPVSVIGTDLWTCEPDGAQDVFQVQDETTGTLLQCAPGYIPQERPTGSGNWVCVAAEQMTVDPTTGTPTYTPLVDASAPQIMPAAPVNPPAAAGAANDASTPTTASPANGQSVSTSSSGSSSSSRTLLWLAAAGIGGLVLFGRK